MREQFLYKSEDWVIKISNLKSSDLKIGDEAVWLSGPDAQITSSRTITASQKVTHKIKGMYS